MCAMTFTFLLWCLTLGSYFLSVGHVARQRRLSCNKPGGAWIDPGAHHPARAAPPGPAASAVRLAPHPLEPEMP